MKNSKAITKKYYDDWMKSKGYIPLEFPMEISYFHIFYIDRSPEGKNHIISFLWFDQAGPIVPSQIRGFICYNLIDDLLRVHCAGTAVFPTGAFPFMRTSVDDPRLIRRYFYKEEEILPVLNILDEHFDDFMLPFFKEFDLLKNVHDYLEYFAKMKVMNYPRKTVRSSYTPLYRLILKAWFKSPDFKDYCIALREDVEQSLSPDSEYPRLSNLPFPESFDALVADCQKMWDNSTNDGQIELIGAPHVVTSEDRANPGPISKLAFAELRFVEDCHWITKQGLPMPDKKLKILEKLRKEI